MQFMCPKSSTFLRMRSFYFYAPTISVHVFAEHQSEVIIHCGTFSKLFIFLHYYHKHVLRSNNSEIEYSRRKNMFNNV
jgi:hypothetical protein